MVEKTLGLHLAQPHLPEAEGEPQIQTPLYLFWKKKPIFYNFTYLFASCRSTPHSSPSQTPARQARTAGRAGGGRGRNPDVLMEIQLSKVCFQQCFPNAKFTHSPFKSFVLFCPGEISTRGLPPSGHGIPESHGPASLPTGVCCAGFRDSRQTGYLTDEQVPLLILEQRNASKSPFQHGERENLLRIFDYILSYVS